MKKIKYLIPIFALAIVSCENFLGDNLSPNDANQSQITPDLQLANAEVSTYRPIARDMNRLGNFFMNNWGTNVNSFAATNPEEYSLQLDASFYNGIWNGIYLNSANFSTIINYPSANYENHKAIAMIMKSFYFQYLVDMYGDIPYFDIHKGSVTLAPKYDNDEDIYRALYVQLNDALDKIDNAPATTNVVGAEDAVFAGNMTRWKAFANTLKLRMMLRVSNSSNPAAVALFTDIQTDLNTNQPAFLAADATINPGYDGSLDARQNPFYGLMYEINGNPRQSYNFFRASKYFGDQLNATADPRRNRLFVLVGGGVSGVTQGQVAQNPTVSYSPLGPGIVVGHSQNGYLISLAESLFLQAEAKHENYLPWLPAAQTLFDNGINASMTQLGATAGTYVANINSLSANIGKGYGVPASTPAQQLQAIMYQKNIALQGAVNGMESFIEHTRTGLIDTIPMATGSTKPNKPRRLLYPTSEYVGNSANVPAQGNVFATGPFWFN